MAGFNINNTTVALEKRNHRHSTYRKRKYEIAHASNYIQLAQNGSRTVQNGRTAGKYGQFCGDVAANANPLEPAAWVLLQDGIVTFWAEELHSMLVE